MNVSLTRLEYNSPLGVSLGVAVHLCSNRVANPAKGGENAEKCECAAINYFLSIDFY